ncbi:hypothetical protein IVB69_06540 [Flavobacterium sp. J49]|uniref:hypothetical protein n=1 Tax=Flavobacterium sp. J49 TaxID=2718534 RepID=UPI001594A067|nr:hypothetical protein [Flavobacterium sp. J49]MBF6641131.1 hypothetical protein [Flavobacterium sp. J49]NIC02378.1 hypothetical protein [Flavobacterium sp. J49]
MKHLLLAIIFLLGLSNFTLYSQSNSKWIHFDWQGETIYGKHFDKVAMSIPLKVENMPYNFCGQFDLGATTTMLYENSFKPFASYYPVVMEKLDTSLAPYYLNGRKSFFLKGLNIQLDHSLFPNRNIALIPNYGDTYPVGSINSPSQKLVGTIAPDLFQNTYLVIDFKNNRLRTYTKLPKKYKKADYVDATIRKGRIKIPINIGDNTEFVLFDTGNCMGDLLLDKETILKFTDANEPSEKLLDGNTWGDKITIQTKRLLNPIFFNGKDMKITNAQFTDTDEDVQFNKEEKIIGLIGPLLFENKTIIIDYIHSKFGMLE